MEIYSTAECSDRAFARELVAITPRLQKFARSLTKDNATAEDLVQDTLVRAWRARSSFELGSNLKSWTFTILKRLFLTARSRMRFVGSYNESLEQQLAVQEAQTLQVHLTDVAIALAKLPEDQHAALQMVTIEQLTYSEVSNRTGVPVGTIKSRVNRARAALATLLTTGVSSSIRPRKAANAT